MTGEELRSVREFYGYDTQAQLANALGVNSGTIQMWESSDRVAEKAEWQLKRILHWNIPYVLNVIAAERDRVKKLHHLMALST